MRVQAEANLSNAHNNAKRYLDLLGQGAVSAQEAEAKETTERVARAELKNAEEKIHASDFVLKQAQERLSMAESGGRREDVQIAQADVQRAQANVHRLEALLAQTVIRAPSDGLITRRDAHIGDSSMSGKSLFTMIRDNEIELRAQVPEKDLAVLRTGQTVKMSSPALGSKIVDGRVREIGSNVDPDTRLCTVRIAVDSTSGLKPGMFAEGRVSLQNYNATTVPSRAVVSRDDKNFVFVFVQLPKSSQGDGASDNALGSAQARFLQIGARTGDFIEVRQGLQKGDLVICSGAGFLKDGDVVAAGK